MGTELQHDAAIPAQTHHRRPRHLAEKFEGYIGIVMVVAIVVLLAGLLVGVVNTGSTPSWMR